MKNEETCVCCGRVIPEGKQVCEACERKVDEDPVPEKTIEELREENKKLRKAVRTYQEIHNDILKHIARIIPLAKTKLCELYEDMKEFDDD